MGKNRSFPRNSENTNLSGPIENKASAGPGYSEMADANDSKNLMEGGESFNHIKQGNNGSPVDYKQLMMQASAKGMIENQGHQSQFQKNRPQHKELSQSSALYFEKLIQNQMSSMLPPLGL